MKAIAMRCTQEQFKSIEPKLKGVEINSVSNFDEYQYLVNNDGDKDKSISNVCKDGFIHIWKDIEKTYEKWDEKVFLEACGIKPKNTMKITKEFIRDNQDKTLKELFPEVCKVELEVGKWYKNRNGKTLFYYKDDDNRPGFNACMEWCNRIGTGCDNNLTKATNKEVLEALTNEAVKRGFKDGVYIKNDYGTNIINDNLNNKGFKIDEDGDLILNGYVLLEKGVWSEIIPTFTIKEAEEKLKCKIVDN